MNHKFRFQKAREYAFFHEHVHLLLVDFERDGKQELFLVSGVEEDGTYILDYPGELFTEQIRELVQSIFFVQVQEEGQAVKRYVLGAFFTYMRQEYALYYDRDAEVIDELVFFRAKATGTGDWELETVTDPKEYQEVVETVLERYEGILSK
jgi:hypothetical protein